MLQKWEKVTVSIELQARFDEEANIKYANQMKDAGINLIFKVTGLKVHSKICVVDRFENDKQYDMVLLALGISMNQLQNYILI